MQTHVVTCFLSCLISPTLFPRLRFVSSRIGLSGSVPHWLVCEGTPQDPPEENRHAGAQFHWKSVTRRMSLSIYHLTLGGWTRTEKGNKITPVSMGKHTQGLTLQGSMVQGPSVNPTNPLSPHVSNHYPTTACLGRFGSQVDPSCSCASHLWTFGVTAHFLSQFCNCLAPTHHRGDNSIWRHTIWPGSICWVRACGVWLVFRWLVHKCGLFGLGWALSKEAIVLVQT